MSTQVDHQAAFQAFAARDLLSRLPDISASQPSICVAGCGDGASTKLLMARWPAARVLGIDRSKSKLDAARADEALQGRSLVSWEQEDVDDHFNGQPNSGGLYDLIFSNVAMHDCNDFRGLLTRLLNRVRPGGTLALHVPDSRPEINLAHSLLRTHPPSASCRCPPAATARHRPSPPAIARHRPLPPVITRPRPPPPPLATARHRHRSQATGGVHLAHASARFAQVTRRATWASRITSTPRRARSRSQRWRPARWWRA